MYIDLVSCCCYTAVRSAVCICAMQHGEIRCTLHATRCVCCVLCIIRYVYTYTCVFYVIMLYVYAYTHTLQHTHTRTAHRHEAGSSGGTAGGLKFACGFLRVLCSIIITIIIMTGMCTGRCVYIHNTATAQRPPSRPRGTYVKRKETWVLGTSNFNQTANYPELQMQTLFSFFQSINDHENNQAKVHTDELHTIYVNHPLCSYRYPNSNSNMTHNTQRRASTNNTDRKIFTKTHANKR